MAELDITEKRIAQDGHISIRWQQQEFDLRVSTLPLIYGEKMLLRLLGGKQNLGRLADLDFSDENRLMLEQAIKLPYGLILATGPTGSGKTTTLYSLLNALKGHGKNIVTIEDPVEYEISGVNQLQVNEKTGMTFAAGLRGILRQDPDIIMVGEIRDPETAEIAIKAASTGHLVLGSLHTNDAMSAVSRLIDLGIAPFLVASCVLAVIGQRLVRKNCQHCLMDYQYPLPKSEGVVSTIEARRGTGCGFCNNLGYLGRIALQEVWLLTAEDREWISQGASLVIVRKQARERGFKTIKMDGLEKVRLGLTTVEEVMLAAMTE